MVNERFLQSFKVSIYQYLELALGVGLSVLTLLATAKYSEFQSFTFYVLAALISLLGLSIRKQSKAYRIFKIVMIAFISSFLSFEMFKILSGLTIRLFYWETEFQGIPIPILENSFPSYSWGESILIFLSPLLFLFIWNLFTRAQIKTKKKSDNEENTTSKLGLIIIFVAVLSTIFVVGFYFWFTNNVNDTPSSLGTFGDFVGGSLNPLLSLLALIALFYTIIIQSRELSLSRKELKNSSESLSDQNKTLQHQRIDSSFFEMLKSHNSLIEVMHITLPKTPVRPEEESFYARETFQHLTKKLKASIADHLGTQATEEGRLEYLHHSYMTFYSNNAVYISHYFRSLYNLFKFIDYKSKLGDIDDVEFYSNLIRAQISDYELIILFYNCLSPLGYSKFKPLVEKYAVLKHVPKSLLFQPSDKDLFDPKAFGTE